MIVHAKSRLKMIKVVVGLPPTICENDEASSRYLYQRLVIIYFSKQRRTSLLTSLFWNKQNIINYYYQWEKEKKKRGNKIYNITNTNVF